MSKSYVITTPDHVVKFITTNLKVDGSIIRLNGFNISASDLVIHELDYLPTNIKVEESCFNGTDIFANLNFKDNSEVAQLRREIEMLKQKQDLMQQAIDELIFGGGVL